MGNQHQQGHTGMHWKVRGSLHPASVSMVGGKSDHSGEHSQEMRNHHLLLSIDTDTMEFHITHVDIPVKPSQEHNVFTFQKQKQNTSEDYLHEWREPLVSNLFPNLVFLKPSKWQMLSERWIYMALDFLCFFQRGPSTGNSKERKGD